MGTSAGKDNAEKTLNGCESKESNQTFGAFLATGPSCAELALVQIEVAYGFACGCVFGFLHRFFEFFG